MTVQAIILDAFGTLIRFGGPRHNPYRRFLRHGTSSAARVPLLTRDVSPEAMAEELSVTHLLPDFRRELDEELAGLALFDEVPEFLHRARHAGIRLAVCSNLASAYGPSVRQLLPELDAYVLSFELGVAKPDPAIYACAAQALGVPPQDCLFMGDSHRCDVAGPTAAGMQARWLRREAGDDLLTLVKEIF